MISLVPGLVGTLALELEFTPSGDRTQSSQQTRSDQQRTGVIDSERMCSSHCNIKSCLSSSRASFVNPTKQQSCESVNLFK